MEKGFFCHRLGSQSIILGAEAEAWSHHAHSQEQKRMTPRVSILRNPRSIFTQSRNETKGMVPPTMGGLPTELI